MITDVLKNSPYIKDAIIEGKKVYFVSDSDVSYDIIIRDFSTEYEFIRVPNLFGDSFRDYKFSSSVYQKLTESLKKNAVRNIKIEQAFTSKAEGFDRSRIKKKITQSHKKIESDKPAFIYNGDIDYSKLTCTSLSKLIEMRKNSSQTILYITQKEEYKQTYGQLYCSAVKIAAAIQKNGIKKHDKLIFQFSDNRNFIECFWACMLIGAVVVPVGVLEDYHSSNVNADKLAKICNLFSDVYIISDESLFSDVNDFIRNYNLDCGSFYAQQFMHSESESFTAQPLDFEEPCMYFFTSGSTGMPKSVGLSQKNVFARTAGEIMMYGFDEKISDFNWMTLTHAAGLIWSHIRDIYLDAFQALADTSVILSDPLSLLNYFSRFSTTTSWAPNFAYAMLANAIDDNVDYGWDLSAASNIYSGGEANVSKSMRAFLKKTRRYGFPDNGLRPAFGMTETSSCITYYNQFTYDSFSDDDMYVPIGTPGRGIYIRIADSENNILKEGETGYLQIKGDTLLREYYNNPEANAASFTSDGYLITGDLGYIEDNNVTLTGREKDIIIINGLNYCIQDIEDCADVIDGVEMGFTAVISVMQTSGENILLFYAPKDEQIFEPENINELKALTAKIKKEIQRKCFLTLNHIIPIRHNDFPRTEIGKKQRNPLKKDYIEGKFEGILREISEKVSDCVLHKCMKKTPISCQTGMPQKIHVCSVSQAQTDSILSELSLTENCELGDSDCVVDLSFSDPVEFYEPECSQEMIKNSFEYILKTLKKYANVAKPLKVVFPVLYNRDRFDVISNSISAVLRTLSLENDNFSFKIIRMDNLHHKMIRSELCSCDKYEEVYYIDNVRYIEALQTCSGVCEHSNISGEIENKLTVVLGGTGGIGQLLCRYISETYSNSMIAVIGRRRISEVADIIAGSGHDNMIYRSADVTDSQQLSKAFEDVIQQTGRKIGCIFNLTAKSVPRNEEMTIDYILSNDRSDIFSGSAAVKLTGLINAEQLRRKYSCKMYVLGSVTADFGMVKMSAYAASNLLAENYCYYTDDEDLVYIGLSGWNNIGMNLKRSSGDMKEFLNDFNTDKNGFLQGFTAETGIRSINDILMTHTGNCLAGVDNSFTGLQFRIDDKINNTITITLDDNSMIQTAKNIIASDFEQLKPYVVYMINPMSGFSDVSGSRQLEERINKIWSKILNTEDINNNDNLFDIGGNSLTVFKIVNEIKENLAVELRPVDIMTYSTVKSLSEFILSRSGEKRPSPAADTSVRKRTLKRGIR